MRPTAYQVLVAVTRNRVTLYMRRDPFLTLPRAIFYALGAPLPAHLAREVDRLAGHPRAYQRFCRRVEREVEALCAKMGWTIAGSN